MRCLCFSYYYTTVKRLIYVNILSCGNVINIRFTPGFECGRYNYMLKLRTLNRNILDNDMFLFIV